MVTPTQAGGCKRGNRQVPLMLLGAVLALGLPTASSAVAVLWSSGLIDLDPNAGIVPALQSLALPSLVMAPVGLVLVAWGAGVRGVLGWTATLMWGLPVLGAIWFVSAAWLGGLAGEPF